MLNGSAAFRPLTARELRQWQLFYGSEPWGDERADIHNTAILAMLYNVNRGKNQPAAKVPSVADWSNARPTQTIAEQKAMALRHAASLRIKVRTR